MRKKTVNHVADTIFWYVLYFLPIVSYLLFCFTEPTRVEQLDTTTETEIVSTMSISSYSLDLGGSNTIPVGDYVWNDFMDTSSLTSRDGSFLINFISNGQVFDQISWDNSGEVLFYGVIGDLLVYSSSWNYVAYKTISITTPQIIDNTEMLSFFTTNLTALNPIEPEPDVPLEPTLNIVPFYDYMISTYQFTENNFIYTVIVDLFGQNGVFDLALDKGIYLYFSWFIGVYLMHLFVDFILFIPRLCHKLLKEFTHGD